MEAGFSFIKTALYELRQTYGRTVQFYSVGTTSTDYQTGVKSPVRDVYTVKKVVKLPKSKVLVPGQVNNNYDQDRQRFVVDGSMLNSSYIPAVKDYVVINRERYIIEEVEELEYNLGYLLFTEYNHDSTVKLIQSRSIITSLTHTNVASGVKV